MKEVTDPAILAQLNSAPALKPVMDPAILAQLNGSAPSGPQPSILDRAIASPVGRFIQSNVVQPLASVANTVSNAGPLQTARAALTGGSLLLSQGLGMPHKQAAETAAQVGSNPIAALGNAENSAYEGSLAANRNTPGYAEQRALADKVMQDRGPSGFMDQLTSQFNPTLAGLSGFASSGGSLDASNAMADAQQQGQNTYQQAHPLMSMGANALGSLLMMPERAPLPEQGMVPRSKLRPGAYEAHQSGYVLPPPMASEEPGAVANGLAGWSGKIKTAQSASEANQAVTNNLAAKAIGIDPEAGITEAGLKNIRTEAGKVYADIPKALPVVSQDADFVSNIEQINNKTESLARNFPNITKNSDIEDLIGDLTNAKQFNTEDGIAIVRQLRRDATANFRAAADPKKLALAQAQRDAADAVDDLIERNLAKTGQEGLIANYKSARQTIAKSYDIQSATNLATGNVNAHRIAALQARGRPLSGELKSIADAASAFPKALQPLDRIGGVEPLSTLDLAAATLSAAHGHYGVGAALLGKPLARAAVLSPGMQRSLMTERSMVPPAPAFQLPELTARSRVPPLLMPLMLPQRAQSQRVGE